LGCFAMLNKNAQGLRLVDNAHSKDTRSTVAKLDGSRAAMPRGIRTGSASIETFAVGRRRNAMDAVAHPTISRAAADSDELARAIADIEIASAALRQSEPSLEPWRPDAETRREKRYLPVWILIGAVWITVLMVLSGATGAILYLTG
jgi:hypothetical protein